jgi:ATP-dependent helicase/nuclease subunit A
MVTPANDPQKLAENTPWAKLQPTLEDHATAIDRTPTPAAGREALAEPAGAIAARAQQAGATRAAAAAPGYRFTTVSRSVKAESAERGEVPGGRGAGAAWGRAVHRVLEWLALGGNVSALDTFAATIAKEELLASPLDGAALAGLVRQTLERAEWKALAAAKERVVEFPVMEWRTETGGSPVLIEGVIDCAYRDDGGWTVLDWKTDVDDAAWAARQGQYQAQVEEYAAMLGRATGQDARGSLVRLTMTTA